MGGGDGRENTEEIRTIKNSDWGAEKKKWKNNLRRRNVI